MLTRLGRVTVFSMLLFLGTAAVAAAQADVVTTTTGEKLVGEIISVEKDVLTMSTAYSDSDFKIEWDKVVVDRQRLVSSSSRRSPAGACRAR